MARVEAVGADLGGVKVWVTYSERNQHSGLDLLYPRVSVHLRKHAIDINLNFVRFRHRN